MVVMLLRSDCPTISVINKTNPTTTAALNVTAMSKTLANITKPTVPNTR